MLLQFEWVTKVSAILEICYSPTFEELQSLVGVADGRQEHQVFQPATADPHGSAPLQCLLAAAIFC